MQSTQLHIGVDNIIKVSGALTFATVNQIWEQSQSIFNRAQKQLNFDLQAVTQSDSAGVALLLAWARTARTYKKEIIFLSLPDQMRAIAKVGGLENILPIKV